MTSAPQAELLFDNGPVFTADGATAPARQAVAVAGGRILAVGPAARELAGPRTSRFDLAGRLLAPGFQDSHIHAVFGGLELGRCDLSALKTADEYLAAIGDYARVHPEQAWITGGGWSLESFPGGLPTAAALDAVVPDRPVFLPNRDHHGAWVNSRALELAGISRDTPDPADGRIERDERGVPTGMLQEGAIGLVEALLPATSAAEFDAALDRRPRRRQRPVRSRQRQDHAGRHHRKRHRRAQLPLPRALRLRRARGQGRGGSTADQRPELSLGTDCRGGDTLQKAAHACTIAM